MPNQDYLRRVREDATRALSSNLLSKNIRNQINVLLHTMDYDEQMAHRVAYFAGGVLRYQQKLTETYKDKDRIDHYCLLDRLNNQPMREALVTNVRATLNQFQQQIDDVESEGLKKYLPDLAELIKSINALIDDKSDDAALAKLIFCVQSASNVLELLNAENPSQELLDRLAELEVCQQDIAENISDLKLGNPTAAAAGTALMIAGAVGMLAASVLGFLAAASVVTLAVITMPALVGSMALVSGLLMATGLIVHAGGNDERVSHAACSFFNKVQQESVYQSLEENNFQLSA